MPSPSELPLMEDDWFPRFLSPISDLRPSLLVAVFAMVVAYSWSSYSLRPKHLPLVNPPKLFSDTEARELHLTSSKYLLEKARKLWPNKPFRMITDWGETVILPGEFANEVRNAPELSFSGATRQDGFGELVGFRPYGEFGRHDDLFQTVAKKHLTKLVAKVTEPLSQEASFAISLNLTESQEWRDISIGSSALDIVARMSSRVFLGNELCRDDAWLAISKGYALNMFAAIRRFQHYPPQLRKLMQWFIPECKVVRGQFNAAADILDPIIAARHKLKNDARAAGKEMPSFNDALEWAQKEAALKGCTFDMTTFQLMLSVVAIHTSTDLLVQTMLDLAQHPEAMQPLRDEIAGILKADGWKKTSLYNMKLLDSVLKETQRLKPVGSALMRRSVDTDMTLSDGTVLKKGQRVQVDTYRMTKAEIYPNPKVWDANRFLNLRQQEGNESTAQLVCTTQDHLGFGHGEHACPGRFFAANELKIALCHLLIKYEWKLAPGTDVTPYIKGFATQRNPTARILIRKRPKESIELDIDDLTPLE
ncbi:cytochrome P450 [Xylaria intraflava]|nr:cytochrome P450 [Xylaria intraflava]